MSTHWRTQWFTDRPRISMGTNFELSTQFKIRPYWDSQRTVRLANWYLLILLLIWHYWFFDFQNFFLFFEHCTFVFINFFQLFQFSTFVSFFLFFKHFGLVRRNDQSCHGEPKINRIAFRNVPVATLAFCWRHSEMCHWCLLTFSVVNNLSYSWARWCVHAFC